MKKMKISLLAVVALTATIFSLHAIPNQIGGFVNIVGLRFEEIAAGAKIWKPRAKLPGNWETWQDPRIKDSDIVVFRLYMTADVFGIRASRVTAQIKDNQILQFDVVFEQKSVPSKSLVEQLNTNIKIFTGEKSSDANKKSFDHKKINIQLKDGKNDTVIVTISPKAKAVVAR